MYSSIPFGQTPGNHTAWKLGIACYLSKRHLRAGGSALICPACGTDNPADRKFCGGCGSALALVCPSCGTRNEPRVKFCGECGTALAPGVQSTAPGVPRATPQSERRLVSVLFADLVGFTS